MLIENVWGYNSGMRTRTLDVHIQRLRKKLGGGADRPQLIITVPTVGYKFQAPATADEELSLGQASVVG